MTKKQSYHPIVLIQNHFENLKNKIDLKIGKLLEDNNLNENNRAEIECIRKRQIEKVEEIKNINLNNWLCNCKGQSFGYDSNLELIKENLIINDCFDLDDPLSKTNLVIWITDWYCSSNDLKFLR